MGRRRLRWENYIRLDLKGIGANMRKWTDEFRVGILGDPL